jgi:hypothetical protein
VTSSELAALAHISRPTASGHLGKSERRYHVAGFIGAEIWRRCLELGWLARQRNGRTVQVTAAGRRGLRDTFGAKLDS